MTGETFGRRLRAERERRSITLESIAASTNIAIRLLRDLERDDLSRWPSGIFRRSFIRAYASAIGLDANLVLQEFLEGLPQSDETGWHHRRTQFRANQAGGAFLRLTLADPRDGFSRSALLTPVARRCGAAALDIAVALVMWRAMFLLVGDWWALPNLTVLAYYSGSILILGNTPGIYLLASRSWTYRPGGRARRDRSPVRSKHGAEVTGPSPDPDVTSLRNVDFVKAFGAVGGQVRRGLSRTARGS